MEELRYDPSQPRDDHGRWTAVGGGSTGTLFDDLEGYDPVRAAAIAAETHAQAARIEPSVTAQIAALVGDPSAADYQPPERGRGEMFGYDFRFKSTDKIAEKIGRVMVEKGLTFDEAAADIKDALRYTAHFSEEEFGERAQRVIDGLRATNPEVVVKNTWPPEKGIPYKGVNVNVTRADGFRYEIQFHTPESQAVKDRMHLLYEQQRVLPPQSARWRQLESEMLSIGNGQPVPRDAYRVFHVVTETL